MGDGDNLSVGREKGMHNLDVQYASAVMRGDVRISAVKTVSTVYIVLYAYIIGSFELCEHTLIALPVHSFAIIRALFTALAYNIKTIKTFWTATQSLYFGGNKVDVLLFCIITAHNANCVLLT